MRIDKINLIIIYVNDLFKDIDIMLFNWIVKWFLFIKVCYRNFFEIDFLFVVFCNVKGIGSFLDIK